MIDLEFSLNRTSLQHDLIEVLAKFCEEIDETFGRTRAWITSDQSDLLLTHTSRLLEFQALAAFDESFDDNRGTSSALNEKKKEQLERKRAWRD